MNSLHLSRRHWLAALSAALLVHAVIGWWLWRAEPTTPVSAGGGGGLDISLASAATAGGAAAAPTAPKPHHRRQHRDSSHRHVGPRNPAPLPEVDRKLSEGEISEELPPEVGATAQPQHEQEEVEESSPEPSPELVPRVESEPNQSLVDATGAARDSEGSVADDSAANTHDGADGVQSGDGDLDGLSGNGGAPGAASESTVANYAGLLQAWLERHKEYPRLARSRRIEGVAMLRFTVDSVGKVLDFELQRSAGNPLLDRAVIDMLERAQPLPAIPPEVNRDHLTVVIPIEFRLRY